MVSFSATKIGFLTIDFDDESAAQMMFLKKRMDKFTKNSVIENISERGLANPV